LRGGLCHRLRGGLRHRLRSGLGHRLRSGLRSRPRNDAAALGLLGCALGRTRRPLAQAPDVARLREEEGGEDREARNRGEARV
jgi:hypothetical protein